MHQRNQQRTKNNRVVQKCTKTLLYQNMRYNSCKKHLLRQVLFCNEINPLRDLWNLLCKWNTPAACEMPAGVRGFISFHFPRRRKISQAPRRLFHILRQQNISPKLFPSVRIYLSKTQIHLFRTPLTLKQTYRPTEKRFAPKCRANLGKHRSAASSQRWKYRLRCRWPQAVCWSFLLYQRNVAM